MTETFCNSGAVKLKAGANVSSSLTAANYTTLINQAEDYINVACKIPGIDLITRFSSLNADVKLIMEDACSSKAALAAIAYDMSGYTNQAEAQALLDVNYTIFSDCMVLLKEKPYTDFILAA